MRPLEARDPRSIGAYTVLGVLGQGGMGKVYLGQSWTGKRVAIKVIRSEIANDPVFRQRFAREVSAGRQISALYTAPIVDADPEGETPWFATTYIEGPSIEDEVATSGPMSVPSVLILAAGLAEAFISIHRAGLVHRDLKPSNVLLTKDGPCVIDFGIALMPDSASITQGVIGTPAYMSPEHIAGEEVGPPSDIYSIGATLAFAATGRGPLGQGTPHSLIAKLISGQMDTSAVPEQLKPIIARCLARDTKYRPTATELLGLLAAAGATHPYTGWFSPTAAAQSSPSPVSTPPAPGPPPAGPGFGAVAAGPALGAAAAGGQAAGPALGAAAAMGAASPGVPAQAGPPASAPPYPPPAYPAQPGSPAYPYPYPGAPAQPGAYPGSPVPSGPPAPAPPSGPPAYPGSPAAYPGSPAGYPGSPAAYPGSPAGYAGTPASSPPAPTWVAPPGGPRPATPGAAYTPGYAPAQQAVGQAAPYQPGSGYPAGYQQPQYGAAVAGTSSKRGLIVGLVVAAVLLVIGGVTAVALIATNKTNVTQPTPPPSGGSDTSSPTSDPTTSTPRGQIKLSAPATMAGLVKNTEAAKQKAADDIVAQLKQELGGAATGVVASFYNDPNLPGGQLLFMGITGDIVSPTAEIDESFTSFNGAGDVKISNIKEVPAGPLGGTAKCGDGLQGDVQVVLCVWGDHENLGLVLFSNRSVNDSKALLLRIRTAVTSRV